MVKKISERWIGWTAGIIDGEGTITIYPRKRTDASCRHQGFQAVIKVANTDPRIINKLKELWGYSTAYSKEKRENRCKKVYYWAIVSKSIIKFLEKIIPYLVIKKEQAKIALEFQKRVTNRTGYSVNHTSNKNGEHRVCGSTITDEEYEIRKKLYLAIKKLNQKGRNKELENNL